MQVPTLPPLAAALCVALVSTLALAGCAAPDRGPEEPDGGADAPGGNGGGNGLAPQHHHAEDAEAGLRAEGDLYPCDGGFCVDARAWNDGGETFHVSDVCVPPWSERMARDDEPVQHREPVFHCQAFGTRPFPPGDDSVLNTTWDGRVWNDEEGHMVPAPPGAYVWSLTFSAHGRSDGGGRVDLVLEFPVVVGQT